MMAVLSGRDETLAQLELDETELTVAQRASNVASREKCREDDLDVRGGDVPEQRGIE